MRQIKLELEPELSACIETKAKQEYQKTLSELLKTGKDRELRERLGLLRLFLETTDFKRLREEYEKHLVSERRVRFTLHLEKGKPEYKIELTHK